MQRMGSSLLPSSAIVSILDGRLRSRFSNFWIGTASRSGAGIYGASIVGASPYSVAFSGAIVQCGRLEEKRSRWSVRTSNPGRIVSRFLVGSTPTLFRHARVRRDVGL